MIRSTSRPGVAKTKNAPLLRTRTLVLVAGSDARWKALFESADIVSEGAPSGEDPSRLYYGSTDIILRVKPDRTGETVSSLTTLASADPHVRLRAMRLARVEAAQRASGPLARVESQITVQSRPDGIGVHIELEARVLPDRRAAPRSASPTTP